MATRSITLEQLLKPYEQANEQAPAVAANTNILAADLTPVKPACLFRIQVCSDTAAVFNAIIVSGGNTQTVSFNDATDLTADALYIFDLLVHAGDAINFQFDGAVNMLRILRVQEIGAGVQ